MRGYKIAKMSTFRLRLYIKSNHRLRTYRFPRIYSYNVHKKSTNKQNSHSVSKVNISR